MTTTSPAMELLYLEESQNEAFDFEYHSEEELAAKLAFVRATFPAGPRRILDIGGGNGVFMDRLLSEFPGAEGYIVDVSRTLLDRNRPDPRKHLLHGSFADLPALVGDKRFDLVTINWVLHHLVGPSYARSLANIDDALNKVGHALADDGVLLVAENEYQGFFGSNLPSHVIYAITSIRQSGFVALARRYFNTAGVGVCFQSQRRWFGIFQSAGFSVDYYLKNDRWAHGWKKHLMFALLFLRTQRHGHFGLRRSRSAA